MTKKPRTARALDEVLAPWGVGVIESYHAPDFFMEWRVHPFVKLIFVLDGAGEFRAGRRAEPFQPRDLLVAPPGVRNRVVDLPGRPAELYILCLSPALLAFDPGTIKRLKAGRKPAGYAAAAETDALFRRLLFHQRRPSPEAPLAMVADALRLVQHAVGRRPPNRAQSPAADEQAIDMGSYIEHLDTHFYEAGSIDQAAATLGLSRRAFTKRFREATGESWLAYVRGRAIEHACRLLQETDKPIAAIAFECGFADLSGFYRHFKSKTRTSPAAWRHRSGHD